MTDRNDEILREYIGIILNKSRYSLSQYHQDQIIEFLDVGEYGLAFEGVIYPYYVEGHYLISDLESDINQIAKLIDIKLPIKKSL